MSVKYHQFCGETPLESQTFSRVFSPRYSPEHNLNNYCLTIPINKCLWNEMPPELRTISLRSTSSWQITKQLLHPAPLSVTPRAFHLKLKFHIFKNFSLASPDPLSPHSPSTPALTPNLPPLILW